MSDNIAPSQVFILWCYEMKKILKKFRPITLTTNQLLLFTCGYIALILNLPFLLKSLNAITELDNYNVVFLLSLPVFLLCLTLILQGLFSFRWVTKPILIFTVIISALMIMVNLWEKKESIYTVYLMRLHLNSKLTFQ